MGRPWHGALEEASAMSSSSLLLILALAIQQILFASATIYIVDGTNGDDNNSGLTTDDAFETIGHCVEKLEENPEVVSECHVREGRYHEVVSVNSLRGEKDNPFVIRGYENEQPIWDGTVPIQPSNWTYEESTGICSADVSNMGPIIALLLDDELMTAARWPNALWSDKTVFENKYWGKFSKSSAYNHKTNYGLVVDNGKADLAASGINATGAMAILNIGSWMTYVSPVLHHEPNTNSFTYNHEFGKVKWKLNQYYLEGSLELLDAPEEWFFDKDTNQLYFIPPAGENCPDPLSESLRGRTLDYGLIITNTTGLTVKNFKFIASNIHAYSASKHEKVNEITLDSLYFKYPSSSHRMLGSNEIPKETKLWSKAKGDPEVGKFSVINSVFEGAEGKALLYWGNDVYIHNNLFLYNDWAGQAKSGGGTVHGYGRDNEFSRNTLYYNGQSAGLRPGLNCTIKYNYIIGQCHGEIQSDGAGLHIQIDQQNDVDISHNWAMDSPKYGIRFDTPSTVGKKIGHDGYIGHNVVWNTNGIMVKGEKHTIENNVALDLYSGAKRCTLCVIYKLRKDPVIMNNGTTAINNAGDQVDGGRNVWVKGVNYAIAGDVVDNNYSGKDVKTHMVDPDNYDFRPISGGPLNPAGKPTIGPYEPESNTYWIPGYKSRKPSVPIPKDGATVASTRDVVMFLEGYEADSHNFFFGSNETLVQNSTVGDLEYKSSLTVDEGNVFELPSLVPGNKYYWRVDAVKDGKIQIGDIWSFNVE